jgi:hypothetical protein
LPEACWEYFAPVHFGNNHDNNMPYDNISMTNLNIEIDIKPCSRAVGFSLPVRYFFLSLLQVTEEADYPLFEPTKGAQFLPLTKQKCERLVVEQ